MSHRYCDASELAIVKTLHLAQARMANDAATLAV